MSTIITVVASFLFGHWAARNMETVRFTLLALTPLAITAIVVLLLHLIWS